MAGVGALAGSTIAIMLRLDIFNFPFLSAVLIVGGLVGFSMLALSKNNPAQILAGYILGFGILYSVFTFI
jgi:membrane-associated phospholipid phosphatase